MSYIRKKFNISVDQNDISVYLREIQKYPILTHEEEIRLSTEWIENKTDSAAHKLVNSHLRLVVKLAMKYRGYGLQLSELISEGNLGLIQSLDRFDPKKGFRLSTYAMWWIRASIQEYILHSWSLVKIGTTAAQKKLFFNLKKLKNQIAPGQEGDLKNDQVNEISKRLDVNAEEVVNMNRRMMGREKSLNDPIKSGEDEEWQDWLVDNSLDQELIVSQKQEYDDKKELLNSAMKILNEREKEIITARRLSEEPQTLEDLSKKYLNSILS